MSMKKVALLVLSLGLAAALGAVEQVRFSINLHDDNNATITVLDKSANVVPGKVTGFSNKTPGRAQNFIVTVNGKTPTEMMLKVKLSGNTRMELAGVGLNQVPKQKSTFTSMKCTSLVVNNETLIPAGKRKQIVFKKWTRLTSDIAISESKEFSIKAVFESVPAPAAKTK